MIFAAIVLVCIGRAYIGRFVFAGGINYFYMIPHNEGITTENFWQSGVDWMVENGYQGLQGFNRWLITQVLIPMKTAFLGMPVASTFVLTMSIGFIVGGKRSMATVGLFRVIISAMIGTDDLGQYILKALSDKNGIGNGLMLGLCVAFMGLTVDQFIQTWARKQREALGLV